jgi:hypothetical protein
MALTDNIVAYYKCDETSWTNLNDEVSTNDWTLTSASFTSWGKINYWLSISNWFDARTQYVSLPTAVDSNNMTISFWTSRTASSSQRYMLPYSYESVWQLWTRLTFGTSSTNYNHVQLALWSNTTAVVTASSVLLRNWTWQFWTITKSLSGSTRTIELFLNWVSQWSNSANSTNYTPTWKYPTLWANASGWWWYAGKIDEVWIWSRVLSSSEITALYNSWNGLQYPFSTTNIKSINGLAKSSIKSINWLAIASVKSWNWLS